MSIAAVSACLDAHVENPSTWRVLVTLADYVDPNGREAYPSLTTLVERTGYSRSTVHAAITQLLEAGLIRRGDQHAAEAIPSNRRPVVYDLVLPAIRGARGPIIGPHQGSDRGPTGVRSSSAQGSDPPDPNQELTQENQRVRATRPVAGVLASLDVQTGRLLGRCRTCDQLVAPLVDDRGRPTGTALHQSRLAGGPCPGAHLPPIIVNTPPGDPKAGAARARTALHEKSSR